MADNSEVKRSIIDLESLPPQFPTHRHNPEFWEALGRVVASYGFLEEVLGKAIFSFTATREYNDDEIQAAYERWLPTLERALYDPLGALITSFEKAVGDNSAATITNLDDLVADLRKVATLRNVLCHGSWRIPNDKGQSVPFFMNKKKEIFDTLIDKSYLDLVQVHVSELCCSVVNTVTHMGWQFPGSSGPGKPIWGSEPQSG